MNSFDLLFSLKKAGYFYEGLSERFLNTPTFEIIVGAVLVQQTKWEKVQKSIDILKEKDLLILDNFTKLDENSLYYYIKDCGFANTKAKRLITIAKNIQNDFTTIENFKQGATREWLLNQKGLGFESSDYILNYALKQPAMVIDSYALRLLSHYGYEFESYDEAQQWFYDGIYSSWDKVKQIYNEDIDEVRLWALFHAKIVRFCKENMRGKKILKELPDLV